MKIALCNNGYPEKRESQYVTASSIRTASQPEVGKEIAAFLAANSLVPTAGYNESGIPAEILYRGMWTKHPAEMQKPDEYDGDVYLVFCIPAADSPQMVTVPVLAGKFDQSLPPIGELRVRKDALPPTPDFVFSLAYVAETVSVDADGVSQLRVVPESYRLMGVSLVNDEEHAAYVSAQRKAEPFPVQAGDTHGDLRKVSGPDEVAAIGRESGEKLRAALAPSASQDLINHGQSFEKVDTQTGEHTHVPLRDIEMHTGDLPPARKLYDVVVDQASAIASTHVFGAGDLVDHIVGAHNERVAQQIDADIRNHGLRKDEDENPLDHEADKLTQEEKEQIAKDCGGVGPCGSCSPDFACFDGSVPCSKRP